MILSYDQNGNLRQKKNQLEPNDKTTYAWDANNRLIQMNQSKTISSNIGTAGTAGTTGTTGNTSSSASTTALSASFSYDAFGRRIQSTITQGSQAPTTVQYLYEGAQALGEIRDGKLSHRLLTGLSLDETIARIAINGDGNKDAANSRLYLTDALNSVIAQLADDDNANIQNSYGYSPYGQSQTVGPDNASNPNQYTSRENDNTGLYYYRTRYYDSVMKRFVSSDPIGLAGGMNSHIYVEGNPVSYTDPKGLAVTITIAGRSYSSTGSSVSGSISVTSDQTSASFSGYAMENSHAGNDGSKLPIPMGSYDALVRLDHTPNRVELINVPGYSNIQIHNGSYPQNFKGCFGAGTSQSTDFLGGTVNAMNRINQIIQMDGSGHIKVIVGPVQ